MTQPCASQNGVGGQKSQTIPRRHDPEKLRKFQLHRKPRKGGRLVSLMARLAAQAAVYGGRRESGISKIALAKDLRLRKARRRR
jgi:hypothetical protein